MADGEKRILSTQHLYDGLGELFDAAVGHRYSQYRTHAHTWHKWSSQCPDSQWTPNGRALKEDLQTSAATWESWSVGRSHHQNDGRETDNWEAWGLVDWSHSPFLPEFLELCLRPQGADDDHKPKKAKNETRRSETGSGHDVSQEQTFARRLARVLTKATCQSVMSLSWSRPRCCGRQTSWKLISGTVKCRRAALETLEELMGEMKHPDLQQRVYWRPSLTLDEDYRWRGVRCLRTQRMSPWVLLVISLPASTGLVGSSGIN